MPFAWGFFYSRTSYLTGIGQPYSGMLTPSPLTSSVASLLNVYIYNVNCRSMKNLIKLFFSGVAMFAFAQCGSSQVFEKDPGFTLDTCHIEPWTAGENDQYQGVNLFFPVISGKEVVLDSVYFGRKRAPLMKIQKGDYLVYKATLETTTGKQDMIMHADSLMEVGNQPPQLNQNPFELNDTTAVVSYLEGGKRKYYKVTGMEPAPAVHYRKRPVQKN